MILPNGSPRIIAIEVPVTTILSASERNFSDTTLTAAGDAIAALVRKELTENLEFYNKPLPKPTTVSSSTQPAWKDDSEEYKPKESASAQGIWERGNKISASTQPAWKVDEIAALVTKALQNK